MKCRNRYCSLDIAPGFGVLLSCLIFASAVALSAPGARPRFERLSIKDGLPRTTILSIGQDDRGFLWVGTYEGLSRYDGTQFVPFVHRPDDSSSLAQGLVRHICVDYTGVVWAATERGISRFNRETESFTTFPADARPSAGLPGNRVRYIYEDRNRDLWVGTEDGVYRFDRDHGRLVPFRGNARAEKPQGEELVRAIVEDLDGRLWLGTRDGLVILNRKDGSRIHLRNDPRDPRSLSSNHITSLAVDHSGSLWVGTLRDGLNRLPRGSTRFVRYRHVAGDPSSLRSDAITQIIVDQTGDVWIGTNGGGLDTYQSTTDRFVHHQKDATDPGSISGDFVLCLFEDRNGILYVGTDFDGLSILDRRKSWFSLFQHGAGKPGGLPCSHIHSVFEDPADSGRTLWLGSRGGGLIRFDRRRETFTSFTNTPRDPFSISDNVVRAITRDSRGYLWVGTANGLNRFDRRTGRFVRYMPDSILPQSLANKSVLSLYEDRRGTLWIGTNGGGLDEYDRTRDAFVHHRHNPDDSTSIGDDLIWCMHEDRSGVLWVGTNAGGLNRYDRSSRKFTRFVSKHGQASGLTSNKVLCLCEDHAGTLWIGTAGGGLCRFDPDRGLFTSYLERLGPRLRTIQAIIEDDHGCLWISTPQGIHQFDPQRESTIAFDVRDGLQANEFQVNAACRSVTGEFFFGGIDGLNSFRPERIELSPTTPPVAITSFQIFSKPVLYGAEIDGRVLLDTSITEKRVLRLSYADEVFTIGFSALDFSPSTKRRFVYRMEGFEKEWNIAGDKHYATYRRIPAGSYRFRVRTADNHGAWGDEGAELAFVIAPPFWETWWFRSLGIALIAALILMAHVLRTRGIRQRSLDLERAVQERTAQLDAVNKELEAFAYSISHDLRTPLRAIDGFSRILIEDHSSGLNESGQKVIAVVRDEVKRMGVLIDDILALSRLGRAAMQYARIDTTAMVNNVYTSITSPEQREAIAFTVGHLPSVSGDPALLRQVWINLISNAVKFTSKQPRASIRIDATLTGGMVTFSVRDNGAGFDMKFADKLFGVFHRLHRQEEFEGTGVGLAIVQRLVQRHGGRVWANAALGKGATFFFTLPLKKA